jgi:NADH dehydrogenase|tara:strand:- start:1341 stop:1556 length:216 start_codon:yes stop_codon:yes gene_type:complete
MDRRRLVIGLPDWLVRVQGRVLEPLPGQLFNLDNYRSLQADRACKYNGLPLLGKQPAELEVVMRPLLGRYA